VSGAVRLAEQEALEPPLEPEQDHAHGPEPETELAAPEVHSPEAGAEDTVVPLLAPQAPLIGLSARLAEQLADTPPLTPAHVQFQGPLPWTDPTRSVLSGRHMLEPVGPVETGALEKVPPPLVPHWPGQALGVGQFVPQSQANAASIQASESTNV
jgi:hypothetical protein